MLSSEIRQRFLDFFQDKDHMVLPSFSLIPQNDPTLLLIGAGMAPLKPFFTGEKTPPHPRVATCQKCVRTPDIERVGETGRHATFFEMLGNFSFGDYFKGEAIRWAWELVTQGFNLPVDRLWVSIYRDDEEAFTIWNRDIGVPAEKIVRLGKEDNFWEIGVGPCGPCSEIYFDLGEEAGCGSPDCRVGCDCDRYLEIWNLVFTQYNQLPSGELETLERKNIDTGAGLERLAMALQGVDSLYRIDTVAPLMESIARTAGDWGRRPSHDELSLRIVTEHLRGISFLVADGVLPSNEGRGYVLRRLLRRAQRHGRMLGIEDAFLYRAVPEVVSTMGDWYPELKEREEYITQIVKLEEDRFKETLQQGMQILEDSLEQLRREGKSTIPGETVFRLYDTYGFPLDLTKEIAYESNLEVPEEEFDRLLEQQRERARKALKVRGGFSSTSWESTRGIETDFVGYDRLQEESTVQAVLVKGERCPQVKEGEEAEILLASSPFYAESGGQVGDTGYLESRKGLFRVEDTYYNQYEQIVLKGRAQKGSIDEGETVEGRVDGEKRLALCRSHTSTHILHRALKERLGGHVSQAGSLVEADRLRFDFTHFSSLGEEELEELEIEINRLVRSNLPVEVTYTTLEEAREMGAEALFEEKYAERVRVIRIGDYCAELCGGTHLEVTGQIGAVKLLREESVGAGLRRIEALTGEEVLRYDREKERQIKNVAQALKAGPEQLEEKLEDWLEGYRRLEDSYRRLQSKMARQQADSLLEKASTNGDINVLSAEVIADDMEALRELADYLKEKLQRAVVVLGAVKDEKVMLIAAATRDILNEGIHAGDLIKEISRKVGGGGGGRPDMAQAGGKNPDGLAKALEEVESIVSRQREKGAS